MRYIQCLLLFVVSLGWANPQMKKANELYHQEKYQEAINLYETIVNSKQHSAALYYNLANAHYKLSHVAPSIYYYEKALLLNPTDADIINNLAFAQAMTIDDIKSVPQVGLAHLIHKFTRLFTYDVWAWISVGLSGCILLLFIFFYFSESTNVKRGLFTFLLVMIIVFVVSVAITIFEKNHAEEQQPAIVFEQASPVKVEPRDNAEGIFVLHEGTKVFIKEKYQNWTKIELLDGSDGWIISKDIKAIK
jgi:tetratricopeptide (TPR) repeat protein